jgi:hypothetical protein
LPFPGWFHIFINGKINKFGFFAPNVRTYLKITNISAIFIEKQEPKNAQIQKKSEVARLQKFD